MPTHIVAKMGDIADVVLLPGDPLRAKFIAENLLTDAVQYNSVRNMLGYTGIYRGNRISVQGTGMGAPSISIYANELFNEFGVRRAIRVGTAGTIQPYIKIRDLVIAMAASTDSGINNIRFGGRDYAPTATFTLLKSAYEIASAKGWKPFAGPIVSSDMFYTENPDEWKLWAKFGCLAIEMECAELYTLAAKYNREALGILTISDSLIDKTATTPEERETAFTRMIEIALETAIS
ncbi:MAG: purine-nucleoside phosphorylase [Spirochaetaceae bacterium]|jgi:purine-nucleoside phosphorylase|nr:purine-nucleoside phosphorylase [Spirochaetaceae bacterium]